MNSESFVSSFLNQDRFITVNEFLIKALDGDCTTAVLLSRLISLYRYYRDNDKLIDGWFFQTVKDLEERLAINDYHQRKSILKLEEKGIVSTKVVGVPPIRYFKLSFDKIEKLVTKELPSTKPKKKTSDKSGFYSALNDNDDWFGIDSVRGNINRSLAEFMFAMKKGLGHRFSGWNPENYGILSRYMEKAYIIPRRPFDYRRLEDWLLTGQLAIKSFIKHDQTLYDSGEIPKTVEEFLKERK